METISANTKGKIYVYDNNFPVQCYKGERKRSVNINELAISGTSFDAYLFFKYIVCTVVYMELPHTSSDIT